VRLGEASFALYILHVPLAWCARVADRLVGAGLERASPRGFCLLYIAGAVLVSLGVFAWLEEPARRWLRARLSRPSARPASAASPG
jgi:peptidoglycan/LPS O-acetylase OafA/YrhL